MKSKYDDCNSEEQAKEVTKNAWLNVYVCK